MITVQAGKEFALSAVIRDREGQLADTETQEITLYTPSGKIFLTVTSPEHIAQGRYSVTFKFPDDAEEGIWKIDWRANINNWWATEMTELTIAQTVQETAKSLEINLHPHNFIVTFLGTKGEIEESSVRHRNTSATIFYHKPHKILVDFGKSYSELPDDVTEVIVTHAHPDHSFGLKGKQLSIPVYMNKFSNTLMIKEDYPFRRKIFWRKPFRIGNVKITPVPVYHSIKAPASGLIFEAAGRKIAYFPDVLHIKDAENVLRNVDVYIGDGASLDKDLIRKKGGKVYGHASIRTQLAWLQKAKVPRAIFTHFGKWAVELRTVKIVFEQLSKEFDVKAREAFDGYRIHIGRTIQLQTALPGVYLVPPHAAHIAEGYKTIIVSSRPAPENFLHKSIYFLQDNKVYGILELTKQEALPADNVRLHMKDQHQITDEEWSKWWPDVTTMYVFHFNIKKLFIPPKEFIVPKGVQKWISSVKLEKAEEIQQQAELPSPFAIVRHYGNKLGTKITLKEVLEAWDKPIVLKKGFITIMGGLANWGESEGDIDILQADSKEIVARDQPILFRLGRAMRPELAERLRRRFVGEYGGAFTSHVPVYDLVLMPVEDRKLVRMQRIEALRDPEGKRQASQSLSENKVIPLRYVAPLKGYRAYYKFPELAAEDIEHEFAQEDYPLYAQKKYDGAITEWMREGDKIIVRTDSGLDVTHRLPELVKVALKILPTKCTILCETEQWIKGEHQPREVVSGYLNPRSKTPPDDSNIVLNVFDIMYYGEDLHTLGYDERYKRLRQIHWGQSTDGVPRAGFNLTPSTLVHSTKEILGALNKTASYIASEGTVIKSAKMTYELDGLTRKMLKWKKLAEIHGIVLRKEETKTKGVFTLYVGVRIPPGWKVPEKLIQKVGERGVIM